ncbi:FxSxx-COOH system tetratricopeptide repeat protein [Actinophytocola sp.]|uniref:FxSxx-COOH system tetratricopeptide repeat protein n=1 Tax=Actinophytocola sp. TaxID=1872138 RepID=UPI002ED0F2F4
MPHETTDGRHRPGLTIADKERLMEALNAVPVLRDPQQRQLVLDELRDELGSQFDPLRHNGTNADNWAMVSTCIRIDAVPTLVSILKLVGGPTTQWHRLHLLVEELFAPQPVLVPAELVPVDPPLDRKIRALLVSVSGDVVSDALRHEIFDSNLLALSRNGNAEDIYSALFFSERYVPLLTYLERVAHHLPEYDMVELHRLIDELAQHYDLGSVAAGLCRSSRQAEIVTPLNQLAESVVDTEEGDAEEDDDPVNRVMPIRAVAVSVPQVWGGVPPRNKHFTGRQDILAQVQRTLGQHSQSALVPQALHGLGGIGKSQLAMEFAYRYQDDYQLVWWIQAYDERSIKRSLVSLAKRLGLPESGDVQDTVDNVLDVLRRGEPYGRWLLIYDDAPEPGLVGPYLPSGAGHVLITSRSRTWASESNAIEVDVFSPDESIGLIRGRWEGLSDEDARVLADNLGHLPLALEQAVAMHEQTGIPLGEYRRALHDNPSQILAEGNPANYPESVASTLSLAFNSVREISPGAAYLLRLCAFLSSQPIALPLLTRGRAAQPDDSTIDLGDDLKVRRAVRDLGRFALVQLDAGRDLLRVHNLVSALIRAATPEDERAGMERHAHAVLAGANPGDPDKQENWPAHSLIAPHVNSAGLVYSLEPSVRRVVLDQIRYHFMIGDFAESRRIGESAVEVWRAACGEDDELMLVASRHLSISLRSLGHYAEARALGQDTLDRMVRTLGPDHEHCLVTAGGLAQDMRLAGEFREALALDGQTLDLLRVRLGELDPDTLRELSNLAVDYRMLGDFAEAAKRDQEAIRLKVNVYGEDNMSTLFSYACLVRDLYGLGEYADGLALATEKLPMHEQALQRPDHPHLLIAKRGYTILLRKLGRNKEALHNAHELHDACRRKFGRSHEHTLSALVTLSNSLRVTGDLDASLRYGQRALKIYREVFREHPFTLACQVDVAITLQALGRVEESNELNDEALNAMTAILGEEHPHTLCAATTKANGLAAAERHEEARELSERILTISRRENVRGVDHPYTLACAANHALDLEATGDSVAAIELRKEIFPLFRSKLGRDHPETLNANAYRRMEADIEVPAS